MVLFWLSLQDELSGQLMLYRVVLIFPEAKDLADFVAYLKVPGEADTSEFSFAGELDEGQINAARTLFGAYVRVVRIIES